ncbi:DNA-binding death effector domain-containing protein 2-like [Carassius carassius]|uniref:DNA-binding death effector domain-containing protein 2-like n=1 Tax=Carassius carassius TaxID=217509 RepID=UPI0028696B1C|nr:DNA-binding death effector domain-containing protein 2-like [Carassius carassius]XP_059423643.1 DNA-binding death effector domain-containing protein 2-like [Carassius carassius]
MASAKCSRYSLYWEETECLSYYEMLSLHEIFEIVGSQLTETDVEVLSFLLDEAYPGKHPLDPEGWTDELPPGPDGSSRGNSPCPRLLKTWRSIQRQNEPCLRPKSGVELLLELERRGYLSEANLKPLLQLLRILTRHDVLPFVSQKKRRTVSPEREKVEYQVVDTSRDTQLSSITDIPSLGNRLDHQWRAGTGSSMTTTTPVRRKRGRGHHWGRKSRGKPEIQPQPTPNKVTCDVRLRVRAEYSEHESALRGGVSSDKQQPLERQFELFSRASALLRTRDLGCIVCDIKFSELANLDAFWADYLSGALLEALKGVFITDSLKRAAGQEGVRLLVSVDQDDYEEGRKLLLRSQTPNGTNWGAQSLP